MKRILQGLLHMSWRLRYEYGRVGLLYLGAELSLRIVGVQRAARFFKVQIGDPAGEDRAPGRPAHQVLTEPELRAVRVAYVVARRVYGDGRGCLRRSLVVGHLLRRHRPHLQVGVGGSPTAVRAHAWLEFDEMDLENSAGLSRIAFVPSSPGR